jgi:hypothetical protein
MEGNQESNWERTCEREQAIKRRDRSEIGIQNNKMEC